MLRIITDTSALYTVAEAREIGLELIPLIVTIDNKTYREYEEITPNKFMDIISEGHIPTSSQPAIGEMVELVEKYMDDELIVISVADGLSGAYQSWLSVQEITGHPKLKIINTKSLAFPQRVLVNEALAMRDAGMSFEEIIESIEQKTNFIKSYLLPTDFDFLKRGGRLTPVAAMMSGLLKIQPIVMQAEDGLRLEKFTVSRNFNIGIKKIVEDLKAIDVNEHYNFGIVHAQLKEKAEEVSAKLKEMFGINDVEILDLSCAFITQGGPHCLAIQVIKK